MYATIFMFDGYIPHSTRTKTKVSPQAVTSMAMRPVTEVSGTLPRCTKWGWNIYLHNWVIS